nr:NUDIX domain-containing protein [Allorhizocola rhizosphaerae]
MPRRSPLRRSLVSFGYGVFYRIPLRWRTRLVKTVSHKYVLGSVVLMFDADDPGRILLLRQPPGRGWTLPAGLLQRGETPIEGARREAAEETGVLLDSLEPAVPNAVVHTRGRWVDMVFTAHVPAATTELSVDGAEVWEAAWHHVDELPKLTPATARLLANYGIGPGA